MNGGDDERRPDDRSALDLSNGLDNAHALVPKLSEPKFFGESRNFGTFENEKLGLDGG
jgi:hypothetical protein